MILFGKRPRETKRMEKDYRKENKKERLQERQQKNNSRQNQSDYATFTLWKSFGPNESLNNHSLKTSIQLQLFLEKSQIFPL